MFLPLFRGLIFFEACYFSAICNLSDILKEANNSVALHTIKNGVPFVNPLLNYDFNVQERLFFKSQ